MSAAYEDDSNALHLPHDDHYHNEHGSRRRRLDTPPERRRVGDGLDYRRPVVSAAAASTEPSAHSRLMSAAEVIDLTDDGQTPPYTNDEPSQGSADATPVPTPARARRLPRFGRDVMMIDRSGQEGAASEEGWSDLPGSQYLALPGQRPHLSNLRRPTRPPSPPPDSDDVEFVEERPLHRRIAETQRSTARSQLPVRPQRLATPYPTGLGETIDLTVDNDDDIVHLDTRPRPGLNNDLQTAEQGGGTMNFGNMGNIATLLREGGANLGGRLMRRLQDFAGMDRDVHGRHQATDRNVRGHRRQGHLHILEPPVDRHARDHQLPLFDGRDLRTWVGDTDRQAVRNARRHGQGIRILHEMPGMMDYGMTAFDLGGRGDNRPPTPAYTPPPPPDKGFTRTPGEDEVVVCPNCGDELAMGDNEMKQEVWAVKSCGHVSF